MARDALITLVLIAACEREPDPALERVAVRLDEIDARITALEHRLDTKTIPIPPTEARDAAKPAKAIRVHVEAESIRIDDDTAKLPDEMLSRRLEEAVRRDGEPSVIVRADPRISAARVTTILDLIELAGVKNVAIARVPDDAGDTDDPAEG